MDGDELGAVGESRLDLNLGHHIGHAVHDVVAGEDLLAQAHELGDVVTVAGELKAQS